MAGAGYFTDENELYEHGIEYNKVEQGRNGNYIDDGYYTGYINAISDAYSGIFFCPPKNVSSRQVTDIVFRYLQNHPESRNKPAYKIVTKSILKRYAINQIQYEIQQNIQDTKDAKDIADGSTIDDVMMALDDSNNYSLFEEAFIKPLYTLNAIIYSAIGDQKNAKRNLELAKSTEQVGLTGERSPSFLADSIRMFTALVIFYFGYKIFKG